MFCPNCRAEYREGFTTCADCDVPLVAELPPEPVAESPQYIEFEEILLTFNAGDIATVKSLLEEEGIDTIFKTNFSTMFSRWLSLPGSWFARINRMKQEKY